MLVQQRIIQEQARKSTTAAAQSLRVAIICDGNGGRRRRSMRFCGFFMSISSPKQRTASRKGSV